jgi:hypothetical protein
MTNTQFYFALSVRLMGIFVNVTARALLFNSLTEEQIIGILKQHEAGRKVPEPGP